MSNEKLLKNPILRAKLNENVENAAGDLLDEISEQIEDSDIVGAGKSADYGNDGRFCTITVECMNICQW